MTDAQWFRIAEVVLAICYMPLLYLRIRRTKERVNVIHLFGTFFFVLAIIAGSWQAYKAPFHYAQPFLLLGILLILTSGTIAEIGRRAKKVKKNNSEGT